MVVTNYEENEKIHPQEMIKYILSSTEEKSMFSNKFRKVINDPFYLFENDISYNKCLACNRAIYGDTICYAPHQRSKQHLDNVKKFNEKYF